VPTARALPDSSSQTQKVRRWRRPDAVLALQLCAAGSDPDPVLAAAGSRTVHSSVLCIGADSGRADERHRFSKAVAYGGRDLCRSAA